MSTEQQEREFNEAMKSIEASNRLQTLKAALVLGGAVIFLAGFVYGMAHVTTEITKGVYKNFGVELDGLEE